MFFCCCLNLDGFECVSLDATCDQPTRVCVCARSLGPNRRRSSKSIFVRNWPIVSQPLALLAIFALLWGIAYSVLPRELTEPNTPFMRLWFLFVGAQISGILVSLTGLPDMLGMLFWGVLYTNVGWAEFQGLQKVEVFLR